MAKLWNSSLNAPTKPIKRTPFKKKRTYKRIRNKAIRFNTRTKATDIPKTTRRDVLVRDNGRCIIPTCNTMFNLQCHHHIPRKPHLGLGVQENLVMLCLHCHDKVHSHDPNSKFKNYIQSYLDNLYPEFDNEMRKFKKY
jgi:5-methylcytosine-specific restriction endonuclease McrA